MLKYILFASIGILLGLLLAKCVLGQTPRIDWFQLEHTNRVVALSDRNVGNWLTMFRCNVHDMSNDCDPYCTEIVTSWQPVVEPLGKNRWKITFHCPKNP